MLKEETKKAYKVETSQGVLLLQKSDVVNATSVTIAAEQVLQDGALYAEVVKQRKPETAEDHFAIGRGFATLGMNDDAHLHFRRAGLADPTRGEEVESLIESLKTGRVVSDHLAWAKIQIARKKGFRAVLTLQQKLEQTTVHEEKELIEKLLTKALSSLNTEIDRLYGRRLESYLNKIYSKASGSLPGMVVGSRLFLEAVVVDSIMTDLKVEKEVVIDVWVKRPRSTPFKAYYGINSWLSGIVDKKAVTFSEVEKDNAAEEPEITDEKLESAVEALNAKMETLATKQGIDMGKRWKKLNKSGRMKLFSAIVAEEHFKVVKIEKTG